LAQRASGVLLWGLLALAPLSWAREPGPEGPAIAIIIDDLGNRYSEGLRTISLAGRITCAFLPHTPYARRLAEKAFEQGKEVMLHLPMESARPRALGPGGVTLDMSERQFKAQILDDLDSVPHVAGINNHMGSLLTRHPGHMGWLMETLVSTGPLYFVDSRTTPKTIAHRVADEFHIPNLERDVFLDAQPGDSGFVRRQFQRLLDEARRRGTAVAIGHPFHETLAVLEQEIARLHHQGIQLTSVSDILVLRQRRQTWHASLSHSPKASRSWRPSP
jgi:hypothetical protein